MLRRRFITGLFTAIFLAASALAGDSVYVDTSGIDTAFPDMTAQERQDLKDAIIADIQANFNVAGVDITVSDDPADAAGADRTVNILDDMGTHERADGSTGHHYGEWTPGSSSVNVHLDNFTDRHGDDYKTDGEWDIDKLRKGIGRTAAHECAHSYSVGHNDDDPPNKMTEGGLVDSATRATTEWIFDDHTSEVMNENLGKKPCDAAADYDQEYIETWFYEGPNFPYDPDEYPGFDSFLYITGPLALEFDLGWLGHDSDGGVLDGMPDFDFIYKASEAEAGGAAPLFTFIEGHHDNIQFLLRGRIGTPFEGMLLPMSDAQIILDDLILTPDGDQVFRLLTLEWDVAFDPNTDVRVTFDSLNPHAPYDAEFNGWVRKQPSPCPSDLNGDGVVDLTDLGDLLLNFGKTGATPAEGDINHDGVVDLTDLGDLLLDFGQVCQIVPPGDDCLSTMCGMSATDFAGDPIPADFFGPGSDPFDGAIVLGGSGGFSDTVLRRLEEMVFPGTLPATAQIQVELVQLDLVSCQPITVNAGTGSSDWNVEVSLSNAPTPPGTLNATKEHANGGTFTAEFFVQPVYTFTRVDDPIDVRVFDTAEQGRPPLHMQTPGPAPWSTDESFESCTIDGFVVGVFTAPMGGSNCAQVGFMSVGPGTWLGLMGMPPICAP